MKNDLSLHQRRRPPNAGELSSIPWLKVLQPDEQAWVSAQIVVVDALTGDRVCRIGKAPTYWFGVVQGLLKMSADNDQGDSFTYAGVSAGGWFGEGTVIKREPYRYNVQALRPSVVAGLPVDSFYRLLEQSIGFNRFVMNQLNERLGLSLIHI